MEKNDCPKVDAFFVISAGTCVSISGVDVNIVEDVYASTDASNLIAVQQHLFGFTNEECKNGFTSVQP